MKSVSRLLACALLLTASGVAHSQAFPDKPVRIIIGFPAGTGNYDHMAGELFKFMAGIDLVHVPYKGGVQALTDTVSGQVAMYFPGVPLSLPLVKAGKVKALGTSGTRRSPAEFQTFFKSEIGKWAKVIKAIGLSVD